MSTIVTRAGKGSALSWTETDANFTNLNTDKAELSGAAFTGNVSTTNITASYRAGFGGPISTPGFLSIGVGGEAANLLNGTSQIGVFAQIVGNANATANLRGVEIGLTTGAGISCPEFTGILVNAFDTNSSSITRARKFWGYADGAALNSVGFQYGQSNSWTGDWSIYCDLDIPSHHAGKFLIGSTTNDGVNALQVTGDVALKAAGNGLKIKEGSNACMGVATLVAGTVVVSTTKVTATSRIFLTVQSLGTVSTPKAVGITARSASTSFTITSGDATDTSVVAWQIVEPA